MSSALRHALLLGALLLTSCAAPSVAERVGTRLDEAWSRRDEVASNEARLAPLLDSRGSRRAGERFWSAWTLSQVHALAAQRVPAERTGHARSAHEVAALYYARHALADLEAALTAERPPLSAELADCAVEDAAAGLELLRLALLGRLGFQGRVRRLCQERPEVLVPERSAQLLKAGGLDPRLRAGVWWVLFEELERVDEGAAFSCAAQAFDASDAAPGTLAGETVARLEEWVRDGASLIFRCPACRQEAVPELRACPNDHTPLGQFTGEARF